MLQRALKSRSDDLRVTRQNQRLAVVTTPFAKEFYIRCPLPMGSAVDATRAVYDELLNILEADGADLSHVVSERGFLRDMDGDLGCFTAARQAAYGRSGVAEALIPPVNSVGQAPISHQSQGELQVYAVVPHSPELARVSTFAATDEFPVVKEVELAGHRHLYSGPLVGNPTEAQFDTQCDTLFARADALLDRHGSRFENVLRTWCYLDNIDRDYDAFNASRNRYFEQIKLGRLPASTGIRASLQPSGTLCSVDLYALLNLANVSIEVLKAESLNEAPDYGSAFSRGMKVGLRDKTVLYISGTASVDTAGATVHLDDFQRQVDRTLLNIEQLLCPQGADFADIVSAITYVKPAFSYEQFIEAYAGSQFGDVPNTIVTADVCRPNLLMEIEAIAVL